MVIFHSYVTVYQRVTHNSLVAASPRDGTLRHQERQRIQATAELREETVEDTLTMFANVLNQVTDI
jgi:CBS domain containing-hemolysin-like protein